MSKTGLIIQIPWSTQGTKIKTCKGGDNLSCLAALAREELDTWTRKTRTDLALPTPSAPKRGTIIG